MRNGAFGFILKSNAQNLLNTYGGNYPRKSIDKYINFVKQLVLTYPDTSIEVSENKLDEL